MTNFPPGQTVKRKNCLSGRDFFIPAATSRAHTLLKKFFGPSKKSAILRRDVHGRILCRAVIAGKDMP